MPDRDYYRLLLHPKLSRREVMQRAGVGLGGMALGCIPAQKTLAADTTPPMAKSVIFLFMVGGPSQVDTFDPKPCLTKYHGLPLTGKGPVKTFFGNPGSLMKSPFTFRKYGESGIEVSELFPNVAQHVDEMCFLRSIYGDTNNHAPALFQMNTGTTTQGNPALGSVIANRLNTGNLNQLPFVVMTDPRGGPLGGASNWAGRSSPSACHGTVFRANETNMLDLSTETEETKNLYGLQDKITKSFGRQCLMARRLVERGTRFVQIYSGGGYGDKTWDAHQDIVTNHRQHSRETDLPIAGLLTDLKRRGLLDSTLVIWGGEFGRMPVSQGVSGRDHNPNVQTVWMAGGGIKGGTVVGSSDELGYYAGDNPHHIRDLHATILHLMGLDIERLACGNNGGSVIRQALA